jgi:hypothetical protein
MKLASLEHPGRFVDSNPATRYRCATSDGTKSPQNSCNSALAESRSRSSDALSPPSEIAGARGGSRNRAYSCNWSRPKNVLTNRSPGHDRAAHLVQSGFQRAPVLRAGRDCDHHPPHGGQSHSAVVREREVGTRADTAGPNSSSARPCRFLSRTGHCRARHQLSGSSGSGSRSSAIPWSSYLGRCSIC